MKIRIRGIIFVVILATFTLAVSAQGSKPTIDGLSFMSGCWEINKPDKKMLVSEQWMAPMGGSMIGMSRTVRNGKTGGYEYLRIMQDDTGIYYISKPSENKGETSFKLVKWTADEAVFENPTHDFPQRIIYKLTKLDALSARIEGTMNGKLTGIDFPMTRAKCG